MWAAFQKLEKVRKQILLEPPEWNAALPTQLDIRPVGSVLDVLDI